MPDIKMDDLRTIQGAPVYDAQGAKIGKVEQIYLDEQTRKPEWAELGTSFFGKSTMVPLEGAQPQNDGLLVPFAKEQVKDAPNIGGGDHIDQTTEQELYAHYGMSYGENRSDSGLPEGSAGTPAANQDAGVVRSEEELAVGKEQVDAGQVRLRKWVETEPVTANVDLQQEVARVEREPINQPVSGAEIGEGQVEVDLHAERPVVQKEALAKERISLDKDVETETAQVSEELRKERVEVEGENVRRS